MNIFFLSENPQKASTYLADIHVGSKNTGGKMIVETSQMLANCYTSETLNKINCPKTKEGNNRKYSYYNHPCSIWVRESIVNFNWLLAHGLSMVEEKIYRGGNKHFCFIFLEWCKNNPPNNIKKNNILTPPALAMPDEYKTKNAVESYRNYYIKNKLHNINCNWTKREPPYWIKEYLSENTYSNTYL